MEYDIVIEGRIVDLKNILEAQIGIEDGVIKEIKKQGLEGERIIKTSSSSLIFPSFIDPHVHLREDSNHEWDYKEDFLTGSKAAAHGGVTTVFDMPNNKLPSVTKERILKKIELSKRAVVDVFFYGGVHPDYFDEIEKMSDSVIGYKVYLSMTTGGLIISEESLEKALPSLSKTNKPIVFHCEDMKLLEKVLTNKDKFHRHIAHVSDMETLNIIKKYKNDFITFETAPHYLIFDKSKSTDYRYSVHPHLEDIPSVNALREALLKGEVDMIGTDHAPHTMEDKKNGIGGVPELDTYGNFISWLIKVLNVDPRNIVKLSSFNIAKLFGLKDRGQIAKGLKADLTILDTKCPTKITSENLYTKCGWSPFEGMEFPGKVAFTIKDGKIIMENDVVG